MRRDIRDISDRFQKSSDDSNGNTKYSAISTAVLWRPLPSTDDVSNYDRRTQDIFVRDNISLEDVLIVSIGGNEIALCPTPCSIAGLLCLPTNFLTVGRRLVRFQ
mmetsp:Transcript_19512/g.34269  ORF Transcript_19512/g.34269 Transcript_19512/m.34269 type:complete len:105 (+) Transcript_19512:150-464(+)